MGRVSPNDVGQVDGDGGIGEFARWIVEGTGDIRKFKSKKTGKYLRIFKENEIDCGGTGGPWTEFKINGENGHEKKLESVENFCFFFFFCVGVFVLFFFVALIKCKF